MQLQKPIVCNDSKRKIPITVFESSNTSCIQYKRFPQIKVHIRYLLRFFDCLAHPNLSATFATDEKCPLCHLCISYQSLAGSLSSLQKSEFLKLVILIFQVKKLNNQCELDVRVIACNFQGFVIFLFFSNFFRSNLFIFESKVKYMYRISLNNVLPHIMSSLEYYPPFFPKYYRHYQYIKFQNLQIVFPSEDVKIINVLGHYLKNTVYKTGCGINDQI